MEQKICGNCFAEMQAEEQVCAQCGCELQKGQEDYPLALPVGTILGGRYILGRVLGQGGFGITYLAQDYQKKERVAVKEYFPDTMATRNNSHAVTAYTGTREDNFTYGKQCFLEEARTLAAFQGNPNIVGIYNYFEENGTAYFVMEYIEGQSLDQYVASQGGRLPWDEALQLLLPIMDALDAVHGRGIIHRDVTPDNICIMADGKVKLLDFGAARYSLGDRSRSLDVVLKHGFAPKEQYSRHGRQGPYTDVYSLAATLYYVLTGRKPPESIDRMEEDDLVLPSSLGVKLPISGEDALIKALAVQPMDRFQSAGEFAQALQGFMVFHTTSNTKQDLPEVPPEVPAPTAKPIKKWKKLTVLLPTAITVLAVITLITVLLSGHNQQKAAYEQALKLYIEGQYARAMDAFSLLDDYRDSKKMALQCSEQLTEDAYAAATDLMAQGAYAEAADAFFLLGDYKDSAKKTEICKTKVLDNRYEESIAYFEAGYYDTAAVGFESLGSYKDSREKLVECLAAIEMQKTFGVWDSISIGDYVTFGTYEQDNNRSNGKEPIEWLVLDKKDNRLLVISKYGLDCQPYNTREKKITWETCSLRNWLNDSFFYAAFDEKEQPMISTVTVENSDNPSHGTKGGNDTQDKIFLLSIAEAYRYFASDHERQCKRTDYALACGVTNYDDGNTWWWLRSSGQRSTMAAGVFPDGSITAIGDYVACGTDSVRPAMWISPLKGN